MIDQYFGIKELYEVVLKAKVPMQFGSRSLEEGEPVLYFENVNMSMLTEQSKPIMARGGWLNMPHVIWEDRSEVQFSLTEGIMSSISMGILLSAAVSEPVKEKPLYVSKREGPFDLDNHRIFLEHDPVEYPVKKTFIYEYERDVAQKKVYGKKITGVYDPWDPSKEIPCMEIYADKALSEFADDTKQYIIDYYYEYKDEALIYTIEKERFNGLFTLEGKFYSKDENRGENCTNIIYMPKVRVVSDMNLRLGERANPAMSVFNIIGMPENIDGSNKKGLILSITKLVDDIDKSI